MKLKDGAVYPSAPAGHSVQNLPPEVNQAWREARAAHAVAAYTAAEMMCRKILMHIAVDKVGRPSGESFAAYLDELDANGYITRDLKVVVDRVRVRGNVANHELPASSETDSELSLAITEYLLEGMYQIPSLAEPGP